MFGGCWWWDREKVTERDVKSLCSSPRVSFIHTLVIWGVLPQTRFIAFHTSEISVQVQKQICIFFVFGKMFTLVKPHVQFVDFNLDETHFHRTRSSGHCILSATIPGASPHEILCGLVENSLMECVF